MQVQKTRLVSGLAILVTAAIALTSCSLRNTDAESASAASDSNFALDYKADKTSGFKVGYSMGWYGNTWAEQHIADIEAVGKAFEANGTLADFEMVATNDGPQGQIQAIEGFISDGVDAIVITAAQGNTLGTVIAKAIDAGILVVTQNIETFPDVVTVGINQLQWSEIQSDWLVDTLGGEGDIVRLEGIAGNSANVIRTENEDRIFKEGGLTVLASEPANHDAAQAQQVMASFLSNYPEIDGVYSHNVQQMGVLQAYRAAGLEPSVVVGDDSLQFLRAWAEEYPDMQSIGVSSQPAEGAATLGVAVRILQGKKLKDSSLSENPLVPGLYNQVYVAPAYVITKEVVADATWMEGMSDLTEQISLEEALALGDGMDSSAHLDRLPTDAELDAYFE